MDMITLRIKDRTYGMRKMPPIKGAAFGIKVANLVSKVLSAEGALPVLQNIQKRFTSPNEAEEGKNQEIDDKQAATLGQLVIRLIANVDPKTVDDIFREAFSWEVYYGSQRLSNDAAFDDHFSQFPGDLYIVAVWATYNHVKDFFTGLGDGLHAFMTSSESKTLKQ